jgi:glycosyltransferase involved in cell wall biosynthesis
VTSRVCLLSRSCLADDPRVRKHGDALASAGHEVVGVGYSGARAPGPAWPVVQIDPPDMSTWRRARRALPFLVARTGPAAAVRSWWKSTENLRWWAAVRDVRADLYLAYDWPVLPLASRLASVHGGRYAYDSREYGVAEYAFQWRWRLLYPPYVHGIEQELVPAAAAVLTVSDGIAGLLRRDLGLDRTPTVVRNVPPFQAVPPADATRPPGDPLRLLYHGLITPGRGLEALLDSVAAWAPGRVLALRGYGPEAFLADLRARAERGGATDRVTFLPPVMTDALVGAAAAHDIGISAFPDLTDHLRYALPNKLFEYVMAGLGVLATDLPDMAALIGRYRLGTLAADASAASLAAAVNGLDPGAVAGYRAAARAAAPQLCWERESQVMLAALEPALG